jgi:hypothetical protein
MKSLQNNIPDISPECLTSGKLISRVPELYAQKDVILINPWHDHQSVFDHTVSVVSHAKQIMEFPFVKNHVRNTRDTILAVALLHDIACGNTLTVDVLTGLTDCPKHELYGRDMSVDICKRWGLPDSVTSRIARIIFFHLHVHRTMNEAMASGNWRKSFSTLHKLVGDIYVELLIQGYADTAGSDLRTLNPRDFSAREKIYKEELISVAALL